MKIGDCVKPLRSKKRERSDWPSWFGGGRTYRVIGKDKLNGEELLVLKTGKREDDYQLVYPNEVEKVARGMCKR